MMAKKKPRIMMQRTAGEPLGLRQQLQQSIQTHQVVTMRYLKKTTGESVQRSVHPYELKGKYLYATCNVHGPNKIHRWIVSNMAVKPVKRPTVFVPTKEWES